MFLAAFGAVWLLLWVHRAVAFRVAGFAAVLLVAAGLLALAYRRYREYRGILRAEADSPARRKAGRVFNIVNALQWIAILVVGNVLANLGLSAWILPAAAFIIGLHFAPLGRVFDNPTHYVTGSALMLLAVGCSLVLAKQEASTVVCAGAGLILWASAAWALRRQPDGNCNGPVS
jgi:hypothetical protein